MAFEAFEVKINVVREFDDESVPDALVRGRRPAVTNRFDLDRAAQDAFGEKKARGEFWIVTWRSHCNGNGFADAFAVRPVPYPYLKRLFDGDRVVKALAGGVRRNAPNGRSGIRCRGFHTRF